MMLGMHSMTRGVALKGVRPLRRTFASVRASAEARTSETPSAANTKTSFHHGITYTTYEGNTFGVKFNNTGVRVLVDPWLEGDLTFFEQDWLYRGKKRVINTRQGTRVDIKQIMDETDVVVISQYLDDHCHVPTLKRLPRNTFMVVNPDAVPIVKDLGFTNVVVVDHGQTIQVADGRLSITATEGASVGPPWTKRQNGLTFREVAAKTDGSSASLYYEPHCDFVESSVAKIGKVDVVVSPITSTVLFAQSVGYPVVMGDINIIKLVKLLQPKVLVPLLNAEIDAEGPISALVFDRGTHAQVKEQLKASNLPVRLEFPAPPGEALAIAL